MLYDTFFLSSMEVLEVAYAAGVTIGSDNVTVSSEDEDTDEDEEDNEEADNLDNLFKL